MGVIFKIRLQQQQKGCGSKNKSLDCRKTGNYAEPEVRDCLISSTCTQEEVIPLPSQPAPTSRDLQPTVDHCPDQPAANRRWLVGRLWRPPLGGSSVPHNSPAGHLPPPERFWCWGVKANLVESQIKLGSSPHARPSQRASLRSHWCLICTSCQMLEVEDFAMRLITLCKWAYKFSHAELVRDLLSRDLEAFPGI